jgi:phosphatidylethanolamine/phosphatidyl-N-methylethanolamine N-methyltransferase
MPLPTFDVLEKELEKHIRRFEMKRDVFGKNIERKIARHRRKIEQEFANQRKRIEIHLRRFEQRRRGIKLDDEVRFLRSWFEKPLTIGSVTPSGRALARAMASNVDPSIPGPIIELGPGTGPVTEALVAHGIAPSRLVLVEFDPTFCRLLKERYPDANVVQGDAYSLRRLLTDRLSEPAAAVVSSLPLIMKPVKVRLRLLYDAFGMTIPGAPFIQFTYSTISPIPRSLGRVDAHASERIWANIPPARVWVYRKLEKH